MASSENKNSRELDEALLVDLEMSIIFGRAGSRVVAKEFSERFGIGLIDAVNRPEAFRLALARLVGEVGSVVVMGRINKRVWGVPERPVQGLAAV
jgi:hypothetical protein